MEKKKGLGRSIKDILSEEMGWIFQEQVKFFMCPVEKLRPNPYQPRLSMENSEIQELAQSIKEKGVLQPLVVTRDGDDFVIIVGERRWKAAKLAGIREVPVIIKDASSSDMVELALVENIQRRDLSCIEEARAYDRLRNEFGLTQEEIALRVGKSRSAVANIMRLLDLPEDIQEDVQAGRLTMGHARALLSLKSPDEQRKVRDRILDEQLSVRETERLVKRFEEKDEKTEQEQENGPKSSHEPVAAFEEQERFLRSLFKTEVKIRKFRKKGQIVIDFHSAEQLEKILSILSGAGNADSSG